MTSHLNTYLSMPITEMARHRNFEIDVLVIAEDVDLSMQPAALKKLARDIVDELKFQPYFHLYIFTITRNALTIRAKLKPAEPTQLPRRRFAA